MANDSQDSGLSIAANIIGLLTFALSALNLVIVRVLQNERRVMEELGKKGWIDSLRALEQRVRYIQLFDSSFLGFRSNNNLSTYAPSNVETPVENSTLGGSPSDEKLHATLKDVQKCYDKAKRLIYQTEEILHVLAEGVSITGYARATIRLILRWDVKGFYEASFKIWIQLRNWRETSRTMDKLEDNYRELLSIVAEVDAHILLLQGIKLLQLQRTIERRTNTQLETVNTVNTTSSTELTPARPSPS
ncbi:hypothetical protein B0T20DRAFT_172781 [Sordaria brevicollis]|uniref:Uncharacterized protein n=1 Tax=Sordaria brevicollis TaxID=83679 RepID=A0AAE0PHK5_SORBR|nr:hypothetical protein B0T20DRAFT_172781 [Sordaria brevicollis]